VSDFNPQKKLQNTSVPVNLEHLTVGDISLKIAENEEEIEQAQRLRYQVFYEELGAKPTGVMGADGREIEAYDPFCDHLLVIDKSAPKGSQIVGTYRILMQQTAAAHGIGLYTETEFDLSKLKATGGKIMEVSRSCVLTPYRSKMAINLLWRGIAAYVFANNVDYLVGTPSLTGVNPEEYKEALAYLNAFHLCDENIRPRVLDPYYHALPQVDKDSIDAKKAFMDLPPLLKGYLRVGAMIGDGAFIDHQFNCVDVAIVVSMTNVNDRYYNRYKTDDAE